MPAKAIAEREHIAHSLRMQYPNKSAEEIEKLSYAIETKNWEKKHGGKAPFVGK